MYRVICARAREVTLDVDICCVTVPRRYLKNGGTFENDQAMMAHRSEGAEEVI